MCSTKLPEPTPHNFLSRWRASRRRVPASVGLVTRCVQRTFLRRPEEISLTPAEWAVPAPAVSHVTPAPVIAKEHAARCSARWFEKETPGTQCGHMLQLETVVVQVASFLSGLERSPFLQLYCFCFCIFVPFRSFLYAVMLFVIFLERKQLCSSIFG